MFPIAASTRRLERIMPAKRFGPLVMIYTIDELQHPHARYTTLHEANVSNPKAKSDACVESERCSLSYEYCF